MYTNTVATNLNFLNFTKFYNSKNTPETLHKIKHTYMYMYKRSCTVKIEIEIRSKQPLLIIITLCVNEPHSLIYHYMQWAIFWVVLLYCACACGCMMTPGGTQLTRNYHTLYYPMLFTS